MIETIDDIIEEMADLAGVYGAHDENESRHCRFCWTAELRQRIKDAVDVGIKLGTWMLALVSLLPAATLTSTPATSCHINGATCATVAVTPHPSWVAPLEGTQWISIAQTGWPLLTWLPNGTVVSFSEVFSLASMPSSAMVTFAADDSASLWLNGALVFPEAPATGNAYTVCSDFAPTCRYHTSVDILPWLTVGSNEIRFDVAQRGGWSFGLNYAGSMTWLDEPLDTPEPGTAWAVLAYLGVARACQWYFRRKATKQIDNGDGFRVYCDKCVSKEIAREALEK